MINDIHEELAELQDDSSVPKNVKCKLLDIDKCLIEIDSLQINKILDVLDEISNDCNLQSYVRSRIWSFSTMFESTKSSLEIIK